DTTIKIDGGVGIGYTLNDLRTDKSETSVELTKAADELLKTSEEAKAEKRKSLRQIRRYQKKIRQRNDRISALEQEIEDLKKSKSWKITARVRKIRNKLGK